MILSPRARFAARPGFSLLEMLIVVGIIALLAGLVMTRLGGTIGQSKAKVTAAQIETTASAISRFELDVGRLPTVEEGLRALIEAPEGATGWEGPYLERRTLPADGWDRPLIYAEDEDFGFVVRSLGADGEPGGEGDDADIDNRS